MSFRGLRSPIRRGLAPASDLAGARVLLTGASGALGTATARALVGAGAHVALCDRDPEVLDQLAEQLSGPATRCVAVSCDLLDDAAIDELPARVEAQLGPIDVLISCAGVEFNARFGDVPFEQLDGQLAIHLRSPMKLVHTVLGGMLVRGRGHVVVVSSFNGKVPFPRKVPYAAAKAGSIAMVHALRRDYAETPVGFSVVLPTLVTGSGQAARAMDQAGVTPPRSAPTATTEQCAAAILRAIREDRAELVVGSGPTGLIAALQWSLPTLADRVLERSGMPDFWRTLARAGR